MISPQTRISIRATRFLNQDSSHLADNRPQKLSRLVHNRNLPATAAIVEIKQARTERKRQDMSRLGAAMVAFCFNQAKFLIPASGMILIVAKPSHRLETVFVDHQRQNVIEGSIA